MDNRKHIPFKFERISTAETIRLANEAYQRISKRRTIRDFSDEIIPEEVVNDIIKYAGSAPSGANMQPWHFAVVKSNEMKKKIRDLAEKEEVLFYSVRASDEWKNDLEPLGTNASKPFLEQASHLIVIFEKKYEYDDNGKKKKLYYTKESVGIATGFLINAIHGCGLVCLTYTPSPMNFLNNLLNRPENEKPFIVIVVGYPSNTATVPQIIKKPLNEISTFH